MFINKKKQTNIKIQKLIYISPELLIRKRKYSSDINIIYLLANTHTHTQTSSFSFKYIQEDYWLLDNLLNEELDSKEFKKKIQKIKSK